jgi:predicted DNA-binding ribbon-helix-helix protein
MVARATSASLSTPRMRQPDFGVCAAFVTGRNHLSMERVMKSTVVKRSIVINGHKTSVSLEDMFWEGLKEIAQLRRTTLSIEVTAIDATRADGNLSSAIRLFVLEHFRLARGNGHDAAALPVMAAARSSTAPEHVVAVK